MFKNNDFSYIIINMRQYIRNILIYLAALLCILSFISIFSNAIDIFDNLKHSWSSYKVNAYLGDKKNGQMAYKGTIIPVFGFVIPLIISIILIIESFKKSWSSYLKAINTVLGVILFICAILVLLTKELFLGINNLGETVILRNGIGPTLSAVLSILGMILLLFGTWLPFKSEIKFIERK